MRHWINNSLRIVMSWIYRTAIIKDSDVFIRCCCNSIIFFSIITSFFVLFLFPLFALIFLIVWLSTMKACKVLLFCIFPVTCYNVCHGILGFNFSSFFISLKHVLDTMDLFFALSSYFFHFSCYQIPSSW